MMYIVAFFKKLWKKEIKEIWLGFCLFNQSDQPNIFVPDD